MEQLVQNFYSATQQFKNLFTLVKEEALRIQENRQTPQSNFILQNTICDIWQQNNYNLNILKIVCFNMNFNVKTNALFYFIGYSSDQKQSFLVFDQFIQEQRTFCDYWYLDTQIYIFYTNILNINTNLKLVLESFQWKYKVVLINIDNCNQQLGEFENPPINQSYQDAIYYSDLIRNVIFNRQLLTQLQMQFSNNKHIDCNLITLNYFIKKDTKEQNLEQSMEQLTVWIEDQLQQSDDYIENDLTSSLMLCIDQIDALLYQEGWRQKDQQFILHDYIEIKQSNLNLIKLSILKILNKSMKISKPAQQDSNQTSQELKSQKELITTLSNQIKEISNQNCKLFELIKKKVATPSTNSSSFQGLLGNELDIDLSEETNEDSVHKIEELFD